MQKLITAALLLFTSFQFSFAQFEGILTVEVKMKAEKLNKPEETQKLTIKIKDDFSRITSEKEVKIVDNKLKKTILLYDLSKTYKVVANTVSQDENYDLYKKTKKTKTILGYKCQEYILETKILQGKATKSVWLTTELKLPKSHEISIRGYPLQLSMTSDLFEMSMSVISIKSQKLSPDEFTIPKDYTEVKDDNAK